MQHALRTVRALAMVSTLTVGCGGVTTAGIGDGGSADGAGTADADASGASNCEGYSNALACAAGQTCDLADPAVRTGNVACFSRGDLAKCGAIACGGLCGCSTTSAGPICDCKTASGGDATGPLPPPDLPVV